MTEVMGIVNVTPDSFSDGGKFFTSEEALRRAKNLIREGASIVDIGGESTRPGAMPISWEEEWARVAPVIEALRGYRMSIDTYHPETAEKAVELGVSMINCVYEAPALAMLDRFCNCKVEFVIPARIFERCPIALRDRCYIDPMIGFSTTRDEDIELIRSLPKLAAHARVLIGVSRKRIIKKLIGEKTGGKDLAGNLALAVWSALNGASMIRVHDVAETVRAIKALSVIVGE